MRRLESRNFCVLRSQPDRNDGSYISEDHFAYRVINLTEVLVGEYQVHAVFSQLRKHVCKAQRGEGCELIDRDAIT